MNIQEIKERKSKLEDEVLDLIVKFEKETQTQVTKISVYSMCPEFKSDYAAQDIEIRVEV